MRLNEPSEKYKEFYGLNVDQMPKLLAEGRVPMSTKDLMLRRVELRHSDDKELRAGWMDNYVDTGDGALYLPDGSLGVVYDSQAIRDLTRESPLIRGALVSEDLPTGGDLVFTKEDLEKMIIGRELTLKEAKAHPIWRALTRGDSVLSHAYAEMVFADHKETRGDNFGMGIRLRGSSPGAPEIRDWYISRIRGHSSAGGNQSLDNFSGRLVGVKN